MLYVLLLFHKKKKVYQKVELLYWDCYSQSNGAPLSSTINVHSYLPAAHHQVLSRYIIFNADIWQLQNKY